jgi:hypothetical protein
MCKVKKKSENGIKLIHQKITQKKVVIDVIKEKYET